MNQFIAAMTIIPSRIINIPKGTLSSGADADIAIINIQNEFIVDSSRFLSKGKNSPFNGWTLKGTVEKTISMGKVYDWTE
jgi:dihydroorotase